MDLKEASNFDETRHPWETVRAEHFLRVVDAAGLLDSRRDWMDVGSGDSFFASELDRRAAPSSSITCWDTNYDDALLEGLRNRHPKMVFTRERPSGRFGALVMLDVLEHVEDDFGFLRRLVDDHLVPGGYVLMSVPAWMVLYNQHDVFLEHHRRYSADGAKALLNAAGLSLVRHGGLFHSLLVPRTIEKLVERIAPRALGARKGASWKGGPLTRPVRAALRIDAKISWWANERGLELPGLSWWALCRK